MKEVYEIFKKIEETSGKNDKVQIIKDNSGNEDFKEFLKFLYDDMITTGLSAKKINKDIKVEGVHTIRGFDKPLDIMEYLTKFNTGTDRIIYVVQSYLRQLEEPYCEFMTKVLTKSYKCGITASSVNKALGKNFIHKFECQLAKPYTEHKDKIEGNFGITQKLDGHRTLAKLDDKGNVTFRTRKGHIINGLHEIADDIRGTIGVGHGGSVVLDGEITILDSNIPIEDVFSETSKIIRKDGDKTGLQFHVFDALSYSDFQEGRSKLKYSGRRESLEYLFEKSTFKPKHLKLVDLLYFGSDKDEISKWSEYAISKGWEGVMLNMDAPYICKRNAGLLKVKEFKFADILCTGVNLGKVHGKNANRIGSVSVDFKGNIVDAEWGMKEAERDYYWNHQDEIVGKIVEVKYFQESTNQKDDKVNMRFAVVKRIRTDKTEDDISYE